MKCQHIYSEDWLVAEWCQIKQESHTHILCTFHTYGLCASLFNFHITIWQKTHAITGKWAEKEHNYMAESTAQSSHKALAATASKTLLNISQEQHTYSWFYRHQTCANCLLCQSEQSKPAMVCTYINEPLKGFVNSPFEYWKKELVMLGWTSRFGFWIHKPIFSTGNSATDLRSKLLLDNAEHLAALKVNFARCKYMRV